MKLTIVGPSYPFKSGISQFTTILVKNLRQAYGREAVDFINWQRQYPGFLYPVDPIDTDSKHKLQEDNVRLLDFYNPFSWYRAAKRVKSHGSQRVIITWVSMAQTPPYLGFIIWLRLLTKVRITYLCHNALPHDPYFFEKFFNRLMYRLADDYIVHSKTDAQDLQNLVGPRPTHTSFHPNYDDFNTQQNYDTAALKQLLKLQPKVLLFFGFIRKNKGLRDLIAALAQLKQSGREDVSLLVVGEFWKGDKPDYDALVQKHGLNDQVVFVDRFIANEEIGQYFAVADILVAPYHSATQSGVIQMAYAFDTPVVATTVGGLPEAVDEGRSGFLCQPHDPKDLAATIQKALSYQQFNLAATKKRFSWASYIKQSGLDEA